MSARRDQSGDASQARFRFGGPHVAKEPVGDDDVLGTEKLTQSRVAGVADVPCDSFADPGLDGEPAVLPVEHVLHVHFRHPLEDRLVDQLRAAERIGSLASGLEDCRRDVHRLDRELDLRQGGTDCPGEGIHLGPVAGAENGEPDRTVRAVRAHQALDQLQLRPVPQEERAERHLPDRVQSHQRMQEPAIGADRSEPRHARRGLRPCPFSDKLRPPCPRRSVPSCCWRGRS